MMLKTEIAIIEAILFLEPEPITVANISKVAGLAREAVIEVLSQLETLYEAEERGLELMRLGDSYFLSPKQSLWNQLKERYGKHNSKRLSKAALETLSIIAYSQPITRGEIESIRGVSSDGMIRMLVERELITEVGRKDVPGRPIQFGTTRNFLRTFGLSSISELPKLDEVDRARFELHQDSGN